MHALIKEIVVLSVPQDILLVKSKFDVMLLMLVSSSALRSPYHVEENNISN